MHFSKKIFSRRGGWGQKFFASWWDGDETGEKRAAARWENRSVVPQGMGIKMRRKRAGLPGGLAKTDRKRSARRGETGAAGSASGRNRGRSQRAAAWKQNGNGRALRRDQMNVRLPKNSSFLPKIARRALPRPFCAGNPASRFSPSCIIYEIRPVFRLTRAARDAKVKG